MKFQKNTWIVRLVASFLTLGIGLGGIENTEANDGSDNATGLALIRSHNAWRVPINPSVIESTSSPIINDAEWPAIKSICEKAIEEEKIANVDFEKSISQSKNYSESEELTRSYIDKTREREVEFFESINELVDPMQCEMLLKDGGIPSPYWFFGKFHHYCFDVDKNAIKTLLSVRDSRLSSDFAKLADLRQNKVNREDIEFYFAMKQLEMASVFFKNTDRKIHKRIITLIMPQFAAAPKRVLIEEGKKSLKRIYENPKYHDEIDQKVNMAISPIDLVGA